ncbi:MAG: VPLPA-CTERM-specific exosortase XrtD [Thermodesulfobacteriota bacterium]|nr:VPLPA-CTERM-specific exosortase XrtD [Thermodesulfobacteriota bacterium]
MTFTATALFQLVLYMALIGGIHYSSLKHLVGYDWNRQDFDYCYLIPLVVLYLLWDRRKVFASLASKPSWVGILPLLFGIFLFLLGELGGEYLFLYLSIWFMIFALCWTHFGWRKMKVIWFPLFIILTMFPPPHFFYGRLTLGMQLLSSKLGAAFLHLLNIPVFREGNILDLGNTQLQIVAACSGLRYLIPMVIVGLLLAYFFQAPLWKRLILLLSTLPLAIVTNGLRLGITGLLARHWGERVTKGAFHDITGWIIFALSVLFLLLEMRVLGRIGGRGLKGGPGQASPRPLPREAARPGSLLRPQFLTAIVLLGATIVFFQVHQGAGERIPSVKSFAAFPVHIGEWVGERQKMAQGVIDELDLTDYTLIEFRNARGRSVNFYVAYYQSQRKGESIHSPETCLLGGGWVFQKSGAASIPTRADGDTRITVNRALLDKRGHKQLAYFWFPSRGRILTNAYELKFYNFLDALTKSRTDGALVRIITAVYPNEGLQDAEARLQGFLHEAFPLLDQYLPGK